MDSSKFQVSIRKVETINSASPNTQPLETPGLKHPSFPSDGAILDRAYFGVQPESFFDSRLTLVVGCSAGNLVSGAW